MSLSLMFVLSVACLPASQPFSVTLDFTSATLLKTNANISVMTADLAYYIDY